MSVPRFSQTYELDESDLVIVVVVVAELGYTLQVFARAATLGTSHPDLSI
jgi:hypothetical protein